MLTHGCAISVWAKQMHGVCARYMALTPRSLSANPYRLADEIHGIGFFTADSLRVMLAIGPTSPFRLHAALKYVLSLVARTEGHVYLPLAELIDRTARQLDERRAATGRWQPDPELVAALRASASVHGDR